MTAVPLFSTNNGYIVKRDGASAPFWSVGYTAPGHTVGQYLPYFPRMSLLDGQRNAIVDTHFGPGTFYPAWSADSGATWSDSTGVNVRGYFSSTPPTMTTDEHGVLWSQLDNGGADQSVRNTFYKSIDNGQTWTDAFHTPLMFTGQAFWAEGGYLWYVDARNDITPNLLTRVSTSGGAVAKFDVGGLFRGDNVFSTFGTKLLLTTGPMKIDVSNAAAPVATAFTSAPGGPSYYRPVTTSIFVTSRLSGVNGLIYVSTDGGATWTLKVTSADLSARFVENLDTDGQNIWCGNEFPHVFFSLDQGATWTEESYDGPSLGSPTLWASVCCGSAIPIVGGRVFGFVATVY